MTRRAILTSDEVRLIRAEYFPYVRGYHVLAKKYGVAESTIRDIVTFRTRVNVL